MSLAEQMKKRRQRLNLQQKDMKLRIGMEQQQYSRIEAGGNANLKNLDLIAEGLDAELMLIPKEKRLQVMALLEDTRNDLLPAHSGMKSHIAKEPPQPINIINDPWKNILD